MLLAMAGAMSTAELGLSLAEMIRRGKIHAISCTGANLEEDVFNLVAHDHYVRIPHLFEKKCWEELARRASHTEGSGATDVTAQGGGTGSS